MGLIWFSDALIVDFKLKWINAHKKDILTCADMTAVVSYSLAAFR
jgi:hypothetical protein